MGIGDKYRHLIESKYKCGDFVIFTFNNKEVKHGVIYTTPIITYGMIVDISFDTYERDFKYTIDIPFEEAEKYCEEIFIDQPKHVSDISENNDIITIISVDTAKKILINDQSKDDRRI